AAGRPRAATRAASSARSSDSSTRRSYVVTPESGAKAATIAGSGIAIVAIITLALAMSPASPNRASARSQEDSSATTSADDDRGAAIGGVIVRGGDVTS